MDTPTVKAVIALRIRIKDPYGYPKICESQVPAKPDPLTIYRAGEDEYYSPDGERMSLHMSDGTLASMIEEHGKYAECLCYGEIAKNLGHEMRIKRLTTGAESTEWQSLAELYRFYKDLADDCQARMASDDGRDSGLVGQSRQPRICGGWPL